MGGDSEYEPKDSRNVTGTASTQDGRWTNVEGLPPRAAGDRPRPQTPGEAANEDEPVEFAPDSELLRKIREGLHG